MHSIIGRREFVGMLTSAVAASLIRAEVGEVPPLLDHFILGCNDLDHGIAFVEQHTGVRAAFGGVHPGRGTRNALLSLGPRRYLEIMAPDPAQNIAPQIARLPELSEPRIVGWAVHVDDLDRAIQRAKAAGFTVDAPRDGSRTRPDGVTLRWRSFQLHDMEGSELPFFIEWNRDSVHPSKDAPTGCALSRFVAETTHKTGLRASFRGLGVDIGIESGKDERLVAVLRGPKGELRSTS